MNKHHDRHGSNASVPAKGMTAPKEHWEKHYDDAPMAKSTPSGAFLPKRSKDRPQPYVKVNECDH